MHNNDAVTKEVAKLDKRKNKSSKETGNTFVVEPTGSATQVNLDGQWEHDFTDHTEHDEKAGK
ncbi:hypothetical protein SPSYN_02451 [Sporotomaculum syntrophicum]|uniref:Uncharacterized protein n=1 Tax=Sporotomaculum syntrophicum TaxID=182264 RepID=A0A9D3AX60_9FIRM|nr:hypothetical protein SPSYN_02451 [Sporotomaculum syntrophicum]